MAFMAGARWAFCCAALGLAVASGAAEGGRPLKQVVEFLSTASELNIALADDGLAKLAVDAGDLPKDKNFSWRAILEVVCRKNKLRIDDSRIKDKLVFVYRPERVTMNFKDADVREAIWAIAQSGKLNVVIDPEVQGRITARFEDVPCDEALELIVKTLGYVAVRENAALRVK